MNSPAFGRATRSAAKVQGIIRKPAAKVKMPLNEVVKLQRREVMKILNMEYQTQLYYSITSRLHNLYLPQRAD